MIANETTLHKETNIEARMKTGCFYCRNSSPKLCFICILNLIFFGFRILKGLQFRPFFIRWSLIIDMFININ